MSYEIFERIYSGHWFLSSYNAPGFVFDFPRFGGGSYIKNVIFIMQDGVCRYVFDSQEFDRAAHFGANRLINDDVWRKKIYKKIDFYTKKYFQVGEGLRRLDLAGLSDDQLISLVRRIIPLQHYHQICSIIVNGVVLDGRNHLSTKIRQEILERLGKPKDFEDQWSLLTQVTRMSLRQKKEYALAQLAARSKNLQVGDVQKRLARLHRQYCWLDYNNFGPAASLLQFQDELAQAKKKNVNLALPDQLRALKKKQAALMKKLKFDRRSRFLVGLAQYIIWQKSLRKDMQYHGFYSYEALFRELARRAHEADWKTFAFLFPWEVERFIRTGRPTVSELKKRRQYSCLVVNKKGFRILTGAAAKQAVKKLKLKENFSHFAEARGQCAFVGRTKGIVRIIQVPADMAKMKRGDILVSQATSPDLLPAMKLAAAIVTNTGGLICHAAITSRELKIPCVVGTINATLIFKDGDRVEVDATIGTIKKV